MRWQVDGAEAATGKETSITVEAATAAEAEQQALYNGILVSKVSKALAAKPSPAPLHGFDKPAPASTAAPEYREIIDGAWFVRLFGGFAHAFGVIIAVGSVAGVGLVLILSQRDKGRVEAEDFKTAGGVVLLGALSAFMYFAAGSVLMMLAAAAEAVRDIARNSFRR